MKILLYAVILIFSLSSVYGAGLEIVPAAAPASLPVVPLKKGQIPQSIVAYGEGPIAQAYLSFPTRRYDHEVLGDAIEAAGLTITLDHGKVLEYELPANRVFEDLIPRLIDLDARGADKIVVVESDVRLGASMAVYGLREGRIVKVAATSFIGRPYRWLNPLGAGDFNGDSVPDLALVSTPHIGGTLKLYSYTPPRLESYAQKGGVSTHFIGSTDLGMGAVVRCREKDLILAPNQQHDKLLLLEWVDGEIIETASAPLSVEMVSGLSPAGHNRWLFMLKNGSCYMVKAVP
jgi:hypothetical protein